MTEQGKESEALSYLRPAEVADLLSVSPKTVTRWAKEGKLPFMQTLGGHRRYPEAEIRAHVVRRSASRNPAAKAGWRRVRSHRCRTPNAKRPDGRDRSRPDRADRSSPANSLGPVIPSVSNHA